MKKLLEKNFEWSIVSLLVLLLVFAGLLAPAQAYDNPVSQPLTFSFTCDTTIRTLGVIPAATTYTPLPNYSVKSFKIFNNSASPVFLGSPVSNIGGSSQDYQVNVTTKGWPICTDTTVCSESQFAADSNLSSWACQAGSALTLKIVVVR